jgi:hypothetical protein
LALRRLMGLGHLGRELRIWHTTYLTQLLYP